MNNKQNYKHSHKPWLASGALALAVTCGFAAVPLAMAADAPGWMHSAASAPLPAHDDKADAVVLDSEIIVTVQSAEKVRMQVRRVYKILRPDGRGLGIVKVHFDPRRKITTLRGWCIPSQGKDYEVKDKEAIDVALSGIEGSELISDVKERVLQIPAAEPGNVVGYEYEVEEQPFTLQQQWNPQLSIPVREASFTLQLPPDWEYKVAWLNLPEVQPSHSGNEWRWVVSDVKALTPEEEMPPWNAISGQMVVSFFPPGGARPEKMFGNWQQMGNWYSLLTQAQRDPSPELKQRADALTAGLTSPLDKMRALAGFVQKEVRYVAIELGIGGLQPHPAAEVFRSRYGDCKDKATLMSSMLREVGVQSYYVLVNSERGSVTPEMQPHTGLFNHAIIAIKLPDSVTDDTFESTLKRPELGTLLFFDPTDELTPLGQIPGYLQGNYALVVTSGSGALVEVPMPPPARNGIQRTAKLRLDGQGTLSGDFEEVRVGDRATGERRLMRRATKDADKVKPIESAVSRSLAAAQVSQVRMIDLDDLQKPLQCTYSVVALNYAKHAANLLLVRPRVMGIKSNSVLESKEARKFPVLLDGPARDTDSFEIALPAGYAVDELPAPVNADYSFASYHSSTVVKDNVLRYTRTFEIKALSVPVSQTEDLKKFYRTIAADERNTAVLKPASN